MKNDVLAIIVTFNRKLLLKECIEALLSQTSQCDILVVDNASTDGTYEYIHEYCESNTIIYENTKKNLGGAGGFNYGVRKGTQLGYSYLWLMDDDTIPYSDSLSELLKAGIGLNNNFGFLSSYAEFTDKNACLMNIPSLSSDWYEGNGYSSSIVKINKATFVSFFVKTDVVYEVGLPIKEFFIWADDSEYTQRISRKYNCYYVLNSKVIHKMNSNGDANYKVFLEESTERASRFFYSFRNRFYIAKQNGIKASIKYFIKLIGILVITLFAAKNGRFKKVGIVLKGISSGIKFSPKIEFVEKSEK